MCLGWMFNSIDVMVEGCLEPQREDENAGSGAT
jgi:hypothetical protein